MANHTVRLPLRNRTGPQRPKGNGDENATSRHVRQASNVTGAGASRVPHPLAVLKNAVTQRPALGEVTTTAVNRKEALSKLNGKEKETNNEIGLKRSRSSSVAAATGPQRVPLVGKALPTSNSQVHVRASMARVQRPPVRAAATHRVPVPREQIIAAASEMDDQYDEVDMEIEEELVQDVAPSQSRALTVEEASILVGEEEVEGMVDVNEDAGNDSDAELEGPPMPRVWPQVSTERAHRYRREVDGIKEVFEDPVDEYDVTMVSEYSEEIFEYMNELEEDVMPSPDYMDGQTEITWVMRQTLVDWLLQVHLRYHMLPETLWIAINIVDRFLTKRIVSVLKLQLVGVTAMFIAAKYEEILAPSVDEFVFMTENGYTKEEILKGERIVLQTLDFKISHYCSPYRLSKFLTEVTLLDHRFLRVKPSMVAAIGMYTARRMLGGDWNEGFVYYSGFTEEHLVPGHNLLVEKLSESGFTKQHVCQKYSVKRFLRASVYAVDWARQHLDDVDLVGEKMVEE